MSSATQRRALRSGTSLWAGSWGDGVAHSPLRRDAETDVAVVGAGISGALVALALAKRGLRVLVLDRRAPMCGSTMASTSLIQFEIDLPLTDLIARLGRPKATRAWRRSVLAVRALAHLVKRERIRCGFAPRSSLYLAGDAFGHRALRAEARARAAAGIPGRFLDADALGRTFNIDRTGAILSTGSAVANPVQLTAGVLRRAIVRGARVHAPADVRDVASTRRGVLLTLSDGHVVRASHAVFCTGYELLRAVPLRGHRVASTWAMASAPVAKLPAWLGSTIVWEGSNPYLYLRTTAEGRVIAGGEDVMSPTAYTERSLLRSKAAAIERKVATLLPGVSLTVTHRWGGAFGTSPSGLPIIDGVPGLRGCHVVAGFGGNGITYSAIAAVVIADRVTGRRDPDAELFRAPRATGSGA